MINKLILLFHSKSYWLGLIILSLCFEAVALFYQYGLEYYPCVLCIHARIWVLGIMLVAIFAFLNYKNSISLLLSKIAMTLIMAGLFERSYQLLGTERGFIDGSCSMDSGLPSWFALDEWFPLMFQVWEPCGYTPELLFGVTMAEALIVISFSLLLVNIALTVSHFFRKK